MNDVKKKRENAAMKSVSRFNRNIESSHVQSNNLVHVVESQKKNL